jgi:hypothetical protein
LCQLIVGKPGEYIQGTKLLDVHLKWSPDIGG